MYSIWCAEIKVLEPLTAHLAVLSCIFPLNFPLVFMNCFSPCSVEHSYAKPNLLQLRQAVCIESKEVQEFWPCIKMHHHLFFFSPNLLLSEQYFNEALHGRNVTAMSCRLFPDPWRNGYSQIKALTDSFVIAKQIMSRTWKALVSPDLEYQPPSEHQTTMPALFHSTRWLNFIADSPAI